MLVLSRKAGESVKIGPDVTITITRINGNRVKIGIDAPTEVHIRRNELPTMFDESGGAIDINCADASILACSDV